MGERYVAEQWRRYRLLRGVAPGADAEQTRDAYYAGAALVFVLMHAMCGGPRDSAAAEFSALLDELGPHLRGAGPELGGFPYD